MDSVMPIRSANCFCVSPVDCRSSQRQRAHWAATTALSSETERLDKGRVVRGIGRT